MKLCRYRHDGMIGIGKISDQEIVSLNHLVDAPTDLVELISRWDELEDRVRVLDGPGIPLASAELLAPIARPGKIFGLGMNYADHAREAGIELPDQQMWFTKAVTSVNDPYASVELPKVSAALDYEAELVFVIGKRCRHVAEADSAKVIFGYCVGNDFSVRDWQVRTSQYVIGKSFDTHAPFGPWIETGDEIDPANLPIRAMVNGEVRQDSNTKEFVFTPAQQVSVLSQAMTLEPGDVIFTGTPGGIGATMQPPQFLKAGDTVRVEIDGIGHIENRIEPE